MSPLLRALSRSSPGSAGNGCSAAGRRAASPNRLSNSDGPNPIVMVRRDGVSPSASPVSAGGTSGVAESPGTGAPRVIASAAVVQLCSIETRSARSVPSSTSNAAKASWFCTSVLIPAWLAPRKATVSAAADADAAAEIEVPAIARPAPATPAPARLPRNRRRESSAIGPQTTFPATWDSGSASALTESASWRRWSCGTVL